MMSDKLDELEKELAELQQSFNRIFTTLSEFLNKLDSLKNEIRKFKNAKNEEVQNAETRRLQKQA